MKSRIIPWVVLFCAVAIIIALSVLLSPKEPTDYEKLNEICDNIGPQGILDYLLDRWSDQEIIEYILDR